MSQPVFVTVGGLVADLIVPIHTFPIVPQEHQVVGRMRVEPGGLGNCLVMASRLGMRALALGWLGDDIFGHHLLASLGREDVAVDHVLQLPGASTVSCVLVDREGQHVFVGSMGVSGPDHLPQTWASVIRGASWVMSDGWVLTQNPDVVEAAIVEAHTHGVTTVFDPGPLFHRLPQDRQARVLEATTVLLLTAEEAAHLVASGPLEQMAAALLARGPSLVVLKRGAAGALAATRSDLVMQPAFPVTVRDTTGAGDAFDAAFIAALAHGLPLQPAALLAAAVGALAVSRLGTGTALPTRREIDAFLTEQGLRIALPSAVGS